MTTDAASRLSGATEVHARDVEDLSVTTLGERAVGVAKDLEERNAGRKLDGDAAVGSDLATLEQRGRVEAVLAVSLGRHVELDCESFADRRRARCQRVDRRVEVDVLDDELEGASALGRFFGRLGDVLREAVFDAILDDRRDAARPDRHRVHLVRTRALENGTEARVG